MTWFFTLLQKAGNLFASPHLPLDSDDSYEARHRKAERVSKARAAWLGFYLPD